MAEFGPILHSYVIECNRDYGLVYGADGESAFNVSLEASWQT